MFRSGCSQSAFLGHPLGYALGHSTQRCRQARTACYRVMFPLLVYILLGCFHPCAGREQLLTSVVPISNGADLARALSDPSAPADLLLENDYTVLRESDFPSFPEPAVLTRNVTILGRPDNWATLNMSHATSVLRLADTVVLSLKFVVVMECFDEVNSGGSAQLLRPMAPGESGVLRLIHGAMVNSLCYPPELARGYLGIDSRPRWLPGNNSFEVTATLRLNGSAPAAHNSTLGDDVITSSPTPTCRNGTNVPPLERCWAHVAYCGDYANPGRAFNDVRQLVPTGYLVHLVDAYVLCGYVLSLPCVMNYSPIGCMVLTKERLEAEQRQQSQDPVIPPPAPSAAVVDGGPKGADSSSGSELSPGAAVGVGVGVGGAVLLALASIAIVFIVRRRRRGRCLEDGRAGEEARSDASVHGVMPLPPGAAASSLCASPRGMGPPQKKSVASSDSSGGATLFSGTEPQREGLSTSNGQLTILGVSIKHSTDGGASHILPNPPNATTSASISAAGFAGPGHDGYTRSTAHSQNGYGALVTISGPGNRDDGRSTSDKSSRSTGTSQTTALAARHHRPVPRPSVELSSCRDPSGPSMLGDADSAGPDSGPGSSGQGGDALALQSRSQQQRQRLQAVVSPLTPLRLDLEVKPDVTQVVKLLPIVRGKGAYGKVYEGLYGGVHVAVKVMDGGMATSPPEDPVAGGPAAAVPPDGGDLSPEALAPVPPAGVTPAAGHAVSNSFAQEVEVLGRCQHPNVVRLLAACLTPPRYCLVMELMETSLQRVVFGSSPSELLPLAKVLHIGTEVAKGLEYLHPTIVHRDLKLDNILINGAASDQPVVKVSDFGLSRLRSTVTPTLHPEAGTPAYMAPECFDVYVDLITHHVDIYSWGVVLWTLLTGVEPWEGLAVVEIAYRVTLLGERLPPVNAIISGRCPRRLQRLLDECWNRVPERRPAAAEVVKQMLLIMQEQEQIAAAGDAGGPGAVVPSSAAADLHRLPDSVLSRIQQYSAAAAAAAEAAAAAAGAGEGAGAGEATGGRAAGD